MFEREFYTLADAAVKIGCTEDDLVYLGAREKLDIYALPGSFMMLSLYQTDDAKAEILVDPPLPLKIDSESIRRMEAGNIELPIKICKKGGVYYQDFFEQYYSSEDKNDDAWFLHEDKLQNFAVTHTDYNQELTIKECKLIILASDINRLISESTAQKSIGILHNESGAQKLEITQTERQTMLKLIVGMAIDAYGYDPEAPKNPATGSKNGISVKLQRHGISISDDTIRKYLAEAKDLL